MFDFEKLIIEVQSRPCLWDIGSNDYHDKPMKMLAWNSVAAALNNNWEELSTAQKEEKGNIFLINMNKNEYDKKTFNKVKFTNN